MNEISEFFGLKDGVSGPHTSRTMMSDELRRLLAHFDQPESVQTLGDYEHAIVDDNILTKPTHATRKASFRFLRELYSLDQTVPLFRALRKLWKLDESSQPLIAILTNQSVSLGHHERSVPCSWQTERPITRPLRRRFWRRKK